MLGVERVDDVGVTAGNGAELVWVWAGEDAAGHGSVCKAESAGCEEIPVLRWTDEELQRAACERIFLPGDPVRIDKMTCRSDEWRRLKDFGGPGVGEGIANGRRSFLDVGVYPGTLLRGVGDGGSARERDLCPGFVGRDARANQQACNNSGG